MLFSSGWLCHVPQNQKKASLYSIKKAGDGWKCTVQSTEKFAIHEVHRLI